MKFLDVPQSGSIAGRTHSHNRAGQYTRSRRSPVQPVGSGRRAIARANFAAASVGWSGLTTAQMGQWDSFAAQHPVTDSLGQSVVLTGHQMFVKVNATRLNVLMTISLVPPADLTLFTLAGTTMAASLTGGVQVEGFNTGSDGKIAFAVSKSMSPGRTFQKTFWQPLSASGVIGSGESDAAITTAEYAAEFGTPTVGQRVWARLTPVSKDGWPGTHAIFSAIWVAGT